MMSHRWDIFFLFPRPHRRVLWYMSLKFPVVEGGTGVGGVGVSNLKSMETVTILTTNHSHSQLSLVRGFHFRISGEACNWRSY